jgi:ABC-2 type transport system ATP-binding protein
VSEVASTAPPTNRSAERSTAGAAPAADAPATAPALGASRGDPGRAALPIEARGLVKRYGEITAVDHVDLTVEPGDVYGFLGPNGAGKTTTLRMLLGLIRPSEGSVRLFGRDPIADGIHALEGVAGFVEEPRFYPYLSGQKNLELLAAYDGGGAAGRIDEALETVSLTARRRHRVGGYSHGMKQRLGIAAALIRRPKLLLLDEPATGLDPGGMRDMRALVRRLADEGMTVLLSSHLLTEVEELCNRVAIVRSGAVIHEGKLDDLLAAAGGAYRLETTDDEVALRLARAHPGVAEALPEPGGLGLRAEHAAVAELSLELAAHGVGLHALTPRRAGLEELFLRLTESSSTPSKPQP